jgi:alpha-L-fucosidase
MQAMKRIGVFCWLLIFALGALYGQTSPAEEPYRWPADSLVSRRLVQWQDWKFGVLIHWGPYSQWGVVESWSLCPEDESWCVRRGPYADSYSTYVQAYEQLRTFFDPLGFDPQRWAAACRQAGMRYVVFTTKHHDGFCMYDSQHTDYKITDSGSLFAQNPRSNVAREVFNAFREQGMGVGAYFSKPDWHSDDYWWPYFPVFDRNVNYNPEKYPDRWQRFQTFTYNQIEELMRDYGAIDLLWLDGGWVRPAGSLTEETRPWLGKNQWVQDINMPAIAAMARRHQPGLLIVDRTVHGAFENYRTPEQQIPASLPPYPWESCITLGDNWYHTGPAERYKSADWAIHTLVKIVARGGNFLLGVGPDKYGQLPPAVYERLEAIGQWMEVNAEAIYASKPLPPYEEGALHFTQSKDASLRYAIYLRSEGDALPASVPLPVHFLGKSRQVRLLGHERPLPVEVVDGQGRVKLPREWRENPAARPAFVIAVNGGS